MRRVKLHDARQIMLSDTGFLDRLPHQLVAAFHATLEAAPALTFSCTSSTLPSPIGIAARPLYARSCWRLVPPMPALDVFNKIDCLPPRS